MTFNVFIILIITCSHAFATNDQTFVFTVPDSSCNPLILRERNLFGLDVKHVGNSSTGIESATYIIKRYSDSVATSVLKSQACAVQANLVNITFEIKPGEIKPPYPQATYYRSMADFYSIEMNELNLRILRAEKRKIIRYLDQNKISYKDFDNELPESFSVPYEFISTIELYTGKMSIWTGAYKEFKAQGIFYCDISKIKKSFSSDEAEKQLEILFSLTHLYAKRLETDLNSRKPKLANAEEIQKIIDGYLAEFETEKKKFNLETGYGSDKIAVNKWETKIKSELSQFK
jgi:hypothetical protein